MECPSCYDLYDQKEKIPRNLPCGHTYCQYCLIKIIEFKQYLECPICRLIVVSNSHPLSFSKNYIALDLAEKQNQLIKKYQICKIHRKEQQFYCIDEDIEFCVNCIKDHSGHQFDEQEYSKLKLKDEIFDYLEYNKNNIKKINKTIFQGQQKIQFLKQDLIQQTQKIKQVVEDLIKTLLRQEQNSITQLTDIYQQQIEQNQSFIKSNQGLQKNLIDVDEKLNNYLIQIDEKNYLNDILFIKNIQSLYHQQKLVNDNFNFKEFPQIQVNQDLKHIINNSFNIQKKIRNPQICFFGEKNRLITYSLDNDEWNSFNLKQPYPLEFTQFSNAQTLPSGEILITGGGISNQTLMISIQNRQIQPMIEYRREHGMIFAQNQIFVIGGYCPTSNIYLKSCEKYNIQDDQWEQIDDMKQSKSQFGCIQHKDQYIYTFGGYDGYRKLNIIEQYNISQDSWEQMDLILPQNLSNLNCYENYQDQIILIGGEKLNNYQTQFIIYDINQNNIETSQDQQISNHKNIRYKGIKFQKDYFIIGGNELNVQKYCTLTQEWNVKKNQNLINDIENIDSWCCALTFENQNEITRNEMINIDYKWDNVQYSSDISQSNLYNHSMQQSNDNDYLQIIEQVDFSQFDDDITYSAFNI